MYNWAWPWDECAFAITWFVRFDYMCARVFLRILSHNRQVSMRHKIHRFWFRLHRWRIIGKIFLRPSRHRTLLSVAEKEMAARKCREIQNIQQAKKMVPPITREASLGQHVWELSLGVNTFDLDPGVPINCVKQPLNRESVCSWHVSHRWTSSLDDHLDYGLVVVKM